MDSTLPGRAEVDATEAARETRPLRRDLLVGMLVALAWLVPITEGAFNAAPNPAWPTAIRDMGAISCLFKSRPERWSFFYLQLRRSGGDWRYWDEHEFFPMEPFGHRTRFDRFMDRFGTRHLAARDDLVRWLVGRDRELHPEQPPIDAVRFLFVTQEIRADQPPQGHWHKPDPTRLARPPKIDSIHPVGAPGRRP